MINNKKMGKIIIAMEDFILLYIGLFATLAIRYGTIPSFDLLNSHKIPFLFVYLVWITIFYIAGLYDVEKFISKSGIRNHIFKTMFFAGVIAVLMFYLIPFFRITPKTNLIINVIIATLIIWFWRIMLFKKAVESSKIKIFTFGEEKEMHKFSDYLNKRPQLGYESTNDILSADMIIVSKDTKQEKESVAKLYEMVRSGKTIIDFDKFFEAITGKIPIYLISETWFLENLAELSKQNFEKTKRVTDIVFSIILFVPLVLLYVFIGILIKTTSRGPILYKQKRVGKNGKIFEIIKFRTMITDAEKNGAQWAGPNDERITVIGNILRKTRIDELPQIWNILKGDISFVGPRPERPEFIKELSQKIPHYSMRQLIRPGLSGWAQVNFPYGASVEDATEKLQYDLYYIKNRSILLDIAIILKTIMVISSRQGR